MPDLPDLRALPGLVASVNLTGSVMPQYAACHEEMRSYNDRHGFHKIEYRDFYAVLVEQGRDSAVHHMMSTDNGAYQWILQIDADAAPFRADAIEHMLTVMFHAMPHADVLGGYCQLKGYPHYPTIDTGSGTWEEHYPGEGIIQVIRTGAHFFMCKRSAFTFTGPPWFRTRIATAPIKAMMEVDNFARRMLGGDNPLESMPEWNTMLHMAAKNSDRDTNVGEDSGFFDKLRARGGHVYVDTDLVVGHVAQKIIMPQDFIDAQKLRRKEMAACLGLA